MTALDRYAKLEAVARYLDGRSADAREVVVSFGERSLVIMELDDRPIAHWPLASLRARGAPGDHPVELAPDASSQERLLLDDREMSVAIAQVCPGLYSPPASSPRRRRRGLRTALGATALALAALAALPFLPDRPGDLVSPEREAALGAALAAQPPGLANPAAPPAICTAEEGLAALRALADRIDAGTISLTVLDLAAAETLALPGGRVVLTRGLLQAARAPEEVAGVLAHAVAHHRARAPLHLVLDRAGPATLARLLFGDITDRAVITEAAGAIEAGYPPDAESAADAAAFALIAAAGLPSGPYAEFAARLAGGGAEGPAHYAARHPWTAARAQAAAAADTIGAAPFTPALRDRDWIALNNICDRTRGGGPF